jgi:hypothetical protein
MDDNKEVRFSRNGREWDLFLQFGLTALHQAAKEGWGVNLDIFFTHTGHWRGLRTACQ